MALDADPHGDPPEIFGSPAEYADAAEAPQWLQTVVKAVACLPAALSMVSIALVVLTILVVCLVAAAALRRVPVVAMEPNAIPGMVTRLSARFTWRALVQFEETLRFFPAGRAEVCGLPVREEFFEIPWRPPGKVFRVLVTGGSRGARTLNRAAREAFPLLAGKDVDLTVQTGEQERAAVAEALAASGAAGQVESFIEDMPAAYAAADLVVSRSGAGAVGELAAAGRPSLLVPFPHAADDHQRHNAEALARAGAAAVVADGELDGARLAAAILELRADPARLERMSRAARALARPGGAQRAAAALEEAAVR